jgi:predicted TIM-barrel fold metal-dependent hydrolase
MPVALVLLEDPERAAAEVAFAIEAGAAAVHVTHDAPPEYSHTHPAYDGVWARLAEAGVPFVLHVGGGTRQPIAPSLRNNGLAPVTDFLGGGENIRSKDYMALHHGPEIFLSVMVLDGLFERFPLLRGGAIELGALWVPPLLARLDLAQQNFRKTEPALPALSLKASEYVHRQLRFTPFPGEPVGDLIAQAGADLFLFSSDYPHPEGTRDPLGRFEATLNEVGDPERLRFFSGNFAELFGLAAPAR